MTLSAERAAKPLFSQPTKVSVADLSKVAARFATSASLKAAIESNFKWRVTLPQYLQTVDLDA